MEDNFRGEEDDIKLRSEDVQEVLGQQPGWILRRGVGMLAVFVAVLLGGSWLFKYPQVLDAQIVLTTETPPANIVAKVSGRLSDIFVEDGNSVKNGMRLAVIENPASINDIDTLKMIVEQIRSTTLRHQPCKAPSRSLKLGSLQNSYSSLLVKLDSYNQFISLGYYPRKISSMNSMIGINKVRERNSARQKKLIEHRHQLQQNSLERYNALYEKGLISREEYEKAKDELFQSELNIENANASMTDNTMQHLQLSSELMDVSKQYLERLSSLTTDLLASVEQILSEIETWMQTYLIVCPIDGIVTFTNFWAKNQNVSAGESVFSVIPHNYKMPIGKLQMPMAGAGRLKIGQTVNVYFENFPEREFGMVIGKVKKVSLIPNLEKKYIVEVSFPEGLKTTYGKVLPLSQEMTGSAKIITDDTRLLEQIFLPIKQILTENV